MMIWQRMSRIPITLRVPALVVLLMIAVSVVTSERVVTRLIDTQERHLRSLAAAYLDGLSSSLLPHVLRGDIWEVFDVLDRARDRYDALHPLLTVVGDADDLVLAASDPRSAPSRKPLPDEFAGLTPGDMAIAADSGRALVRRTLTYQGRTIGSITAKLDISHLLAERRDVTATLILSNALLTLILAGAGYLLVRRMVRPVRILSDHLREGSAGEVRPIPRSRFPSQGNDFRQLFESYNSLVEAETERRSLAMHMAEEERLAALGRLASGMAHEINNPLGGLFNALDTLKQHGDTPSARTTAISIVERGLVGIRDVVRAALATYRPGLTTRPLAPGDLEDLALLIRPEVRRKRLDFHWTNTVGGAFAVPGAPVRQLVLNVLINACNAAGETGRIEAAAWVEAGNLMIEVGDSGPGMPAEAREQLVGSPGAGTGGGLGLWIVRRHIDGLGGRIEIERSDLGGALVRMIIPAQREGLSDAA
ncbi:sensor histidine kinase [Amorphus coralli]|uniref:sensor histidine kinase n=1 Tax=Amorphus coralli TaxID=340680 RepID=UPI00036DBA1C|nr:HAMP domain-containing sensor histidine kinase [Amorphus coralli]